ncbi:Pullulanase 1, chloroplastic [Trifolium repens]|nr:Pullulanase 1, chloroplastic [Trifolium repens]
MGKLNGGFESETLLSKTQLSGAGITHVHLLPTFLFAGVDDQKENWRNVDTSVEESFPPDSDQQQALITAIQHFDGYNLGFNPVLWGVPKGSYASNPNGPNRAIEFRKMVEALNHTGLCIVLDTVYNHLQGSGPSDAHSVLDKVTI